MSVAHQYRSGGQLGITVITQLVSSYLSTTALLIVVCVFLVGSCAVGHGVISFWFVYSWLGRAQSTTALLILGLCIIAWNVRSRPRRY